MDESARDVREQTRSIYQLVEIQPKTHAPPRIRFRWGAAISFQAIVERVEQSFELFAPTGVPLRAPLSVPFREYKTLEEQLQDRKSAASGTSVYVGDDLAGSRIITKTHQKDHVL